MAIIIEGPDNSGKSTLCGILGESLKMPVFHAGGPVGELNDLAAKFCIEQLNFCDHKVILDRVTPISRQIYENRFGDPELSDFLKQMINHVDTIIIYCRPPNETLMDLDNHEVKKHDTDQHIAYVLENQQNLVELYDRLMSKIPNLIYDWTGGVDIESLSKALFKAQINLEFKQQLLTGVVL